MKCKKLGLLDAALIGLWAAMTFAVKIVLAPIANVELVSLLLCTFTVVMGLKRGVLCALVFTTLTVFESSYYGAGDWIALYYINWPLLTVLTRIFLGKKQNEFRAATAGIKWLLFGPVYALTYLVSGIAFDLMHGAANFVSALFLYQPCITALDKVRKKAS